MTKVAAVLVAALALLTSCSRGEAGSRYASCIDLDAVEDRAIPEPLTLPEDVRVTELEEEEGFTVISAVADSDVDGVYAPMERRLEEAGFDVIGRDYEGFEAELFFVSERESAGVVRIRIGPCPDQVTLSILYDPIETKEGRDAIDRAREEREEDPTP